MAQTEDKLPFPGFVGPSYTGRSKRFDAQRAVNMYVEIDESQGAGKPSPGKNQQNAVQLGTPGLKYLQTIGSGPIREGGMYTISDLELTIIVSGNQVFQLSGPNGTPVPLVGNLSTLTGPVSIADNGVQVLIVDGVNGYYQTIGDLNLNLISDPNFYPSKTVTFQDGYFILTQTGTTNFFISDLYSVDFLPLNQSAKTGNPDILIDSISVNRQLYLLGARTLEIWWDAGASGSSPFQRQDGRFSQQGCAAPASVEILGESFYWLSSNSQGGGVVMGLVNAMPQRISTHAIEYLLQNAGDLSQASAYSYQQEGHYFYVLNVPGLNTTLVYDTSTNFWHERQSSIDGVIGRHIGNCHAYLNLTHIVGDYRNGNIYEYDLSYDKDNGQMLPRIRRTPSPSLNGYNTFMSLLEIDMKFGVGLVDDGVNPPYNVEPKISLRVSEDGAQTWSNPISADLGRQGAWATRARFDRLGCAYDPVFELTVTDAVEFQMLSAMLQIEQGNA